VTIVRDQDPVFERLHGHDASLPFPDGTMNVTIEIVNVEIRTKM
jgi:hypothetical protein